MLLSFFEMSFRFIFTATLTASGFTLGAGLGA